MKHKVYIEVVTESGEAMRGEVEVKRWFDVYRLYNALVTKLKGGTNAKN